MSLFVLILGIISWDFYHQASQKKTNNNEIKMAKPSLASMEKDIAKRGIQAGSPAPDFQLENMSGKMVKLSDYKGKTVILNFWATWCPPCKTEMPYIEDFYIKNKDKNVIVLAINLTNLEKNKNDIQQFINDHHLTFPVLLDGKGKVAKVYQNLTIPTTFIIDKTGRIVQKIVGPTNRGTLESLVRKNPFR